MLYGILSIAYWVVASIEIVLAAIRTCGMSPDSVEFCDPAPINMVVGIVALLFAGLSFAFFKARIFSVDA